jgi:hypothetical protein
MKKLYLFFLPTIFLLLSNPVKAEEEIIFFYSDSCPFCHDVLEAIDEYQLDEKLNILKLEAGEENFTEIYHEHLGICDVPVHQGGYPTIYYNQECSFGKTNNINLLLELAQIEEVKGEIDSELREREEDTAVEEIEKINNPSETLPPMQKEPIPAWLIIPILVGPAIFIYIAYLMIKKLNL